MRQFFIILAAFMALTACNHSLHNSTQPNATDRPSKIEPDNTAEDSGQVVVLLPDTDSINFSGSITKVTYPSKKLACNDSLTNYSCDCLGRKLNFHVPCDYLRTTYLQYTEGEILTIHYPDSGRIRILCGYQAEINIDNKKNKGLFSKKVTVKGYQITYEDVPINRVKLFNSAFDLLDQDIQE